MPNELANTQSLIPSREDTAALQQMSVGYIPSIKLLQMTSPELQSNPGWKAGEFCRQEKHLGTEVKSVVISRRDHAILFNKNSNELESYKLNSPTWKRIAGTKKDNAKQINPIHGMEWLFWLADYGCFATIICGKPSSKPMSDEIISLIKDPQERIPAEKDLPHTKVMNIWSVLTPYGPTVKAFACHVTGIPMDEVGDIAYPTKTDIENAVELFLAPTKVEEAPLEETTDTR